MLVTALEAQSENIPKWELVIERLLHQESKIKEEVTTPLEDGRKALIAGQNKGSGNHLLVITVTSLVILRKIAESI